MNKTSSSQFVLDPSDVRLIPANGHIIPRLGSTFEQHHLVLPEGVDAPIRYVHQPTACWMRRYTAAYVRDLTGMHVSIVFMNDDSPPFIKEVGRSLANGVLINHIESTSISFGDQTASGRDFLYLKLTNKGILDIAERGFGGPSNFLGRFAMSKLTAMDYSHSFLSKCVHWTAYEGNVK